MTVTNLDDLLHPARVSLDDEGRALYAAMLNAEQQLVMQLVAKGCSAWRETDARVFAPVQVGAPAEDMRRRWVVLVPQPQAVALHRQWSKLLKCLQPSRAAFSDFLADHATTRTPNAGQQSTALPQWLHWERAAVRVRYSIAQAFRAGQLDEKALEAEIQSRIDKVEEHIDVAKDHKQKQRLEAYESRRADLLADLGKLQRLAREGIAVIGRVSSGHATRLGIGWSDGTAVQTSLQHVVLVTAEPGVMLERAPQRNRVSAYGEPVAQLVGGRLLLYAKPQ